MTTGAPDDEPGRLSCGVVVVRHTDAGWVTLMLRAFRIWDFPKGMREAGEAPLQTAVREVAEESGLRDLEFRWGETFIQTDPYSRGKVARYYLAETKQGSISMGISPETGRPEHHEYRWFDFDSAYDIASPRVKLVVRWARQIVGA